MVSGTSILSALVVFPPLGITTANGTTLHLSHWWYLPSLVVLHACPPYGMYGTPPPLGITIVLTTPPLALHPLMVVLP